MTIVEKMGGKPGQQTISEVSSLLGYKLISGPISDYYLTEPREVYAWSGELDREAEKISFVEVDEEIFNRMKESKIMYVGDVNFHRYRIPVVHYVGVKKENYHPDKYVITNNVRGVQVYDNPESPTIIAFAKGSVKVEQGTKEEHQS
jgi:uncharacterized protein involved in tolerance to divalent cations